jgi:transposase InsO family protein
VSIAGLASRFGVSRKTVYKWIERHRQAGQGGLVDRSRRPHRCPHRTPAQVERAVLALRGEHPAWGGRKLHHRLKAMGVAGVPSPSTITRILREHGRIDPADSATRKPWQRFERAAPNDLWQMDFKSPVPLAVGGACHPLTVLDDHSRYALGLHACENQQRRQVRDQLTRWFERYGLPWAMLSDNGSPWRSPRMDGSLTRLEVWLMRLDIRVLHGRPYHPQTQGKDERFHRTMDVEVLQGRRFRDRASVQSALDPWRGVYNHERPHEALGMATPGERYRPSRRSMPRVLPPVEYDSCDQTRRVDASGLFRFQSRRLRAGMALAGESIGLRATATDGAWSVYYGRMRIGVVD